MAGVFRQVKSRPLHTSLLSTIHSKPRPATQHKGVGTDNRTIWSHIALSRKKSSLPVTVASAYRAEKSLSFPLEKSFGSTIDRAYPSLATFAIPLIRRTQQRRKAYPIHFRCTSATPVYGLCLVSSQARRDRLAMRRRTDELFGKQAHRDRHLNSPRTHPAFDFRAAKLQMFMKLHLHYNVILPTYRQASANLFTHDMPSSSSKKHDSTSSPLNEFVS